MGIQVRHWHIHSFVPSSAPGAEQSDARWETGVYHLQDYQQVHWDVLPQKDKSVPSSMSDSSEHLI